MVVRIMKFLIGLDPGGNRHFGWCVVADTPDLPRSVAVSGLANNAEEAVSAAIAAIPVGGKILCAGIDSPLFWPVSGPRDADLAVRASIRDAGAPHAAGTVQDVNSLRGACLVQGVMAALKLRDLYPTLPITEAHPKALLWLLPAVAGFSAASEHERDAFLAAIAAWATAHERDDWHDLLLTESPSYSPISQPLHYFIPSP
jgi:hypothetical protein